jgi:hypothetical protein
LPSRHINWWSQAVAVGTRIALQVIVLRNAPRLQNVRCWQVCYCGVGRQKLARVLVGELRSVGLAGGRDVEELGRLELALAGGGPFRVILKNGACLQTGFGCPPDPIEAELGAAIARVAGPTAATVFSPMTRGG